MHAMKQHFFSKIGLYVFDNADTIILAVIHMGILNSVDHAILHTI